jgi:hypothetical protein
MQKLSKKLIREIIIEEIISLNHPILGKVINESQNMRENGCSQPEINLFIHENILVEKEEYDTSAFVEYLKRTLSDLIVSHIVESIPGVQSKGFLAFMISETVPAVIMNTSWDHLKSIYQGEGVNAFADILVDTLGDVITGPGLARFADALGLEVHAEVTKFLAAGFANMLTQGEQGASLKKSISDSIRSLNLEDIFSSFGARDLLSFIPGIEMPDKLIGTEEREIK